MGPMELSGRGSKDARRQRATSHMLEQAFTGNRIHTDGPGTFRIRAKIVAVKQMITINLPALPLFWIYPHANQGDAPDGKINLQLRRSVHSPGAAALPTLVDPHASRG